MSNLKYHKVTLFYGPVYLFATDGTNYVGPSLKMETNKELRSGRLDIPIHELFKNHVYEPLTKEEYLTLMSEWLNNFADYINKKDGQ